MGEEALKQWGVKQNRFKFLSKLKDLYTDVYCEDRSETECVEHEICH